MAMQILMTNGREPVMAPVIPRPTPMKVLVLGLSRTGTMSMWVALKKLGIRPYHFMEVGRNFSNGHMQLWTKAVLAKYHGKGQAFQGDDFDQMLWNYDAVTDAPSCLFVDELLAAYPDAKVVLTTRTRESWMRSMRKTFLEIISWRSWYFLGWFDRGVSRPYFTLLDLCAHVWSRGAPAWKPSSYPIIEQSFDEHYAHVREVVPADRLLEFHPSQGWAPLCEFLDLSKPDEDFPHVNDGDDVTKFHAMVYWSRWIDVGKRGIIWVGAPSVALGLAWWLRRK